MNVNGAIFSTSKAIGVGVSIRDNEGRVEATLSKKLPVPLGPLETKAKALEEGVQFVWDVGIRDIILEYDSKIVSEAMGGFSDPHVSISKVIDGIRVKMQDFRRFEVSHVKRYGNHLVHLLACYPKNILDYDSFSTP